MMKKIALFLLFLLLAVVGIAYWALLTTSGNDFLRPYIEENLNKKLPVKATLKKFHISPLELDLQVGKSTSIKASGELDPFAKRFDIHYDIKIARLEDLEPLTKQKLRGALVTTGDVKGNKEKIDIIGSANVADGAVRYHAVLKDFNPSSLDAKIRGAKLQKILYMLYQPHFADALIDSDIHLTNLEPEELTGSVVSHITKGRTDAKALQEQFGLQNANIAFRATQKSLLHKGVIRSDIDLLSSVADIHTKGAKFVIPNGRLNADYVVKVADLGKLSFLTKKKMRGSVTLTGKIKKDKNLLVTVHSNTLGGRLDAKLLNNNLDAILHGIKVVKLTHMLYYPKIFDSSMDAKLHYNLATKKGKLNAQAHDGRILPNKMSFLLKQMANFDITREIYKLTELNSTIDDKLIISDLDMQSRLTHISAKKAKLDLDKERVDARLHIEIQGRPVYVKITGKLQDPKIKLDLKELLKGRVKKELKKQLLKKGLDKKLPAEARELLNNLF